MEKLHSVIRKRFTYRGIIQGVGFRPAVYRSAAAAGVSGYVQNRRSVVVAEVEGTEERVGYFEEHFRSNIPDAARVESVETEEVPPLDEREFSIIESGGADYLFPPIPPDLAICSHCLRELLDNENRRYLYPFITCTQCGPRYSIVEDTPFDRETTSMDVFIQCPECLREYADPLDRRFHSQTNSCARCGPRLTLRRREDAAGEEYISPEKPVEQTVRALGEGRIAAIQGIGGFHLAADPQYSAAVETLRRDKEREAKPFALMVRDIETARRLCYVNRRDEELLTSPLHPIVIMEARPDIAAHFRAVSDTGSLGIMLPYTPLHVLLFSHPEISIPYDCLIMTSGNRQNEPIITDPEEAVRKLKETADLFLYHNRRILMYSDDSVLRTSPAGKDICIIRRSRGYVPEVLHLPREIEKPVLAAGGDLKNSAAYGDGKMLYLSPYAGDLENPLALAGFGKTVDRILELYKVRPERIVCDMHPGYHSRDWALANDFPDTIEVQHHHAHILSVMAEHGLEEAIGIAFDGTGFGTDGTIWGGEIVYADRFTFRRLGSLLPFRLPGAEAAVKQPGRTAFSILHSYSEYAPPAGLLGGGGDERNIIIRMIESELNSPVTTSAGRLFDAAAFLLAVVDSTGYEGEGPIKLEWAALKYARERGLDPAHACSGETAESAAAGGCTAGVVIKKTHDLSEIPKGWSLPSFVLDFLPILEDIVSEKENAGASGLPARVGELSYRFHRALAEGTAAAAELAAAETGIRTVCLGGGVFQNMLLRSLLFPMLHKRGLEVRVNRNVSPGDGGLALGQAYVRKKG